MCFLKASYCKVNMEQFWRSLPLQIMLYGFLADASEVTEQNPLYEMTTTEPTGKPTNDPDRTAVIAGVASGVCVLSICIIVLLIMFIRKHQRGRQHLTSSVILQDNCNKQLISNDIIEEKKETGNSMKNVNHISNTPHIDNVIEGTFTNDGGTLIHEDSDVEVFIPCGAIENNAQAHVVCKIFADMNKTKWNVPVRNVLVCPVVELDGPECCSAPIKVTLRHNIASHNSLRLYRAPSGSVTWREIKQESDDVKCEISEDVVTIETKYMETYMCTCPDDAMDKNSKSAVVIFQYEYENDRCQDLYMYVYILNSIYYLTDCIKHLHGNMDGTHRCVPFLRPFCTNTSTNRDTLRISLTWRDASWVAIGEQAGKSPVKKIKHITDIAHQPSIQVGFKMADFHIKRPIADDIVEHASISLDIVASRYSGSKRISRQVVWEFSERIELKEVV